MASPIKCRTFCDRMFKCSDYVEKEGYAKGIALLFNKFLRKYSQGGHSFLELFASEFSSRVYTGTRFVYAKDRNFFKKYAVDCASNLDLFLSQHQITHLMDTYTFRNQIKGNMGGQVAEKKLNIQFSYKNVAETQKELDFFELNNYIYNQVNGIDHDCLVMSVPFNGFYLVDYDEKDYTIRRGFITAVTKNRMKRRGEHCLSCKNRCKPTFINGLDRFRSIK